LTSHTTERFWKLYYELPEHVRRNARDAYRKFAVDPSHPGLQFKPIRGGGSVYSARINLGYRALGVLDGDVVTWFFIGNHDAYEREMGRR